MLSSCLCACLCYFILWHNLNDLAASRRRGRSHYSYFFIVSAVNTLHHCDCFVCGGYEPHGWTHVAGHTRLQPVPARLRVQWISCESSLPPGEFLFFISPQNLFLLGAVFDRGRGHRLSFAASPMGTTFTSSTSASPTIRVSRSRCVWCFCVHDFGERSSIYVSFAFSFGTKRIRSAGLRLQFTILESILCY